jgi:uncharacterized protein (TIGR03083 family)
MDTRLSPARYLGTLRADGDRLVALAGRDLDRLVPTCPGWTVRDLAIHVARVYLSKIRATRLLAEPENPPPNPPGDPVDWLDQSLDALIEMLVDSGPEAPSKTWWPADQTVGFWYRRMAQETAIHRADAESALDQPTPVADDLAVDGIDELLMIMLEGDWSDLSPEQWGEVSPDAGAGAVIEISCATLSSDRATWRVFLDGPRIDVSYAEDPSAAELARPTASLTGEPSDLLLWLWGRPPIGAVDRHGDETAVAALRDRIVLATQ